MEKFEDRLAMLRTGGDCSPYAFQPPLACFTARPLRYLSIKDYKTNRLLGNVISGIDARRGNEGVAVFAADRRNHAQQCQKASQ
jgi:hypothetical protein